MDRSIEQNIAKTVLKKLIGHYTLLSKEEEDQIWEQISLVIFFII